MRVEMSPRFVSATIGLTVCLFKQALEHYKKLLTYSSSLTKNYIEKSINNLLDLASASTDMQFLDHLYSETLKALEVANNEVLTSLYFINFESLF